MSEVNPDPIAKLAKFTPATSADPADLLFAAGRASARTPRGWKAAVVSLALSNVALCACLLLVPRDAPTVAPVPAAAVPQQPEPILPSPASVPVDDPWSYRTLRATDPEFSPTSEPVANLTPPRAPLTARSGRAGDID